MICVRDYFTSPGPKSAAMARIALATSLLLVLWQHRDTPSLLRGQPAELYNAIGILKLLGPTPLSVAALLAIYRVGTIAATLLLIGLWTRFSAAIALLASLTIVSASFSFDTAWSHGSPAVFLAGICLLPCRMGDRWSIDARLRHHDEESSWAAYGVTIRAAQWMLGLFFFNAAYWKLSTTGVAWIFSDNMRNILAIRFHLFEESPTLPARLGLHQAWASQTMACLNLVAQAMPLLMCPLLRHRWAQIVAAGAWAFEAIGLHYIMWLFGWQMLPLAVIFINWDRPPREEPTSKIPRRWQIVGAILASIVAYQTYTAFTKADHEARIYPFTSCPMYSIRYGPTHLRTRFDFDPRLPAQARHHIRHRYSGGILPGHPQAARFARRKIDRIVAEAEHHWGVTLETVRASAIRYDLRSGGQEPIEVGRDLLDTWRRQPPEDGQPNEKNDLE